MWCFALVTGPHWLPWSRSLSKQPCVHAHWLQSCLTLCDPMGYNPPDSSVHGILEARILEWVASPSSKRSSRPQDWTYLSCITGKFFTHWATWEAPKQPCAHLKIRVSIMMERAGKATGDHPTVSATVFNTHFFYLDRHFKGVSFYKKCTEAERQRERNFSHFGYSEIFEYLPIIHNLGQIFTFVLL